MLTTQAELGRYPVAGRPWLSTPFGRDALITALQTLWLNSGLAHGVLTFLAAHQAHQQDVASDAEPGEILHEMRGGEMVGLGAVPFACYYGSVDSTPLFVWLTGVYYRRSGDRDFIESIWPDIRRTLEWIDLYGDADGDAFVERGHASGGGSTGSAPELPKSDILIRPACVE